MSDLPPEDQPRDPANVVWSKGLTSPVDDVMMMLYEREMFRTTDQIDVIAFSRNVS